ncbi:MAG: putative addiction module antidote protein [Spirochaetes bacterium]|nr:putative addiction module antidote protein [Spirochaetota bacterium]
MKTDVKEKAAFARYDPAEYINTKEDVIALLEVALEENDPEFLLEIIGDIARSEGMAQIARDLNLSWEGNPSLTAVARVLDSLGFCLNVKLKTPAARQEAQAV